MHEIMVCEMTTVTFYVHFASEVQGINSLGEVCLMCLM